jgi:hypothetical protein
VDKKYVNLAPSKSTVTKSNMRFFQRGAAIDAGKKTLHGL